MALFATSNFYLFLKELTHKSWPNKKLVESVNFGKKIGNVKNDDFCHFYQVFFSEELTYF